MTARIQITSVIQYDAPATPGATTEVRHTFACPACSRREGLCLTGTPGRTPDVECPCGTVTPWPQPWTYWYAQAIDTPAFVPSAEVRVTDEVWFNFRDGTGSARVPLVCRTCGAHTGLTLVAVGHEASYRCPTGHEHSDCRLSMQSILHAAEVADGVRHAHHGTLELLAVPAPRQIDTELD
ncbi:hypothetical protein ACFV2X_52320 [Streptomyces sp. NPDC059679]|uniref:hypothetical protein n=1 Tax=Streptomyces sp. NPDC059679 TaxID=3346903 RepID=UPI0036B7776D